MSPVWPLCFKYTGSVLGKGFIAQIELCGRVLAIQDVDGVWLNGVTPAAMAVTAPTISAACPVHRDALTKIFIDFAQESANFEEFEVCLREFFEQADDEIDEWNAAVARIEAGKETIPEGLQRCPNPEVGLKVNRLKMEQVTPADNPLVHRENQELYAAALPKAA